MAGDPPHRVLSARCGTLQLCVPVLFGFLISFAGKASAQTAPATYWVRFTDKANTPYSINDPAAFLSQRAIDRRTRQDIAITEQDLPVDPAYISALLAAGQFQLLNRHKWFNAVTIHSTDTLALDTIASLPFVAELRSLGTVNAPTRKADKFPITSPLEKDGGAYEDTYGDSFRQISMMNGHLLHTQAEARGEGMLIGILDSGFDRADSLPAFAELRARHGIVLTRDFVQPGGDVYADHWHGRSVLSLMAGHVEGRLLGVAPGAEYALLRTENADSEYPVEEDNWISGAEVADSLGCDVLNTSLGYTAFDDSTQDHTIAQLDGMTTRISIAAGIASRNGMVVCNSAGNSGASPWHFISPAADAIDILAVGAVLEDRSVAAFSGRGPSVDGRVKPDVSAMGQGTIGLDIDGVSLAHINGTSFSSPLVCGLAACLWQLHRDQSAHRIMDAIRRSSSHFDHPNDSIGYGIPDFWRAHLMLGGRDLTHLQGADLFNVHPMPYQDHFDIDLFSGDAASLDLTLFDVLGRPVWSRSFALEAHVYTQLRVMDPAIADLPSGTYTLHASLSGQAEMTRTLVHLR